MGGLKNAPRGVHPSGNKKILLDQITRDLVNQDDPYANITHQGIVLYSSYLTESFFVSKYEEPFINEVIPNRKPNEADGKRTIVESIVYIDKICGFLPRPDKFEEIEFYKYLKSLTTDSKSQGFDAILESSKSMSEKNKNFLKKIERYPRAYSVLMGDAVKINDQGVSQKVLVRFPYSYDTYAGIITGYVTGA